MTYAPESLKVARRYLLDQLDAHPGQDVDSDLDPDEVGIVSSGYGDSYHRGKGYIGSGSYSAYFDRDRRGLSGASSALDIGEFDVTINGRRLTLFRFNAWLVAQCEANTPDTLDIREVIYTLDGRTVKRWDRHKRRDSGDDSHLWHTHISYYRDSENNDKTALFRRYIEGDDVSANEVWNTDGVVKAPNEGLRENPDNKHWAPANILRGAYDMASQLHRWARDWHLQNQGEQPRSDGTTYGWKQLAAEQAEIKAKLAELQSPTVEVDYEKLAAALAPHLSNLDIVLRPEDTPS